MSASVSLTCPPPIGASVPLLGVVGENEQSGASRRSLEVQCRELTIVPATLSAVHSAVVTSVLRVAGESHCASCVCIVCCAVTLSTIIISSVDRGPVLRRRWCCLFPERLGMRVRVLTVRVSQGGHFDFSPCHSGRVHHFTLRPEIRQDYRLDLSISLSRGKETN